MILYRPVPQWQLDPNDDDPHGNVDCTSFAGAMGVDAISRGTVRPTGHQIRSLVPNEPDPDPADPGINLQQLLAALLRMGARFSDRSKHDALALERDLAAHRWIVLATWYPDMGGYRLQKPGNFGHAIGVMAISTTGDKVLVYDPLAKAARWVPKAVVYHAAETWGVAHLGYPNKGMAWLASCDAIPYAE